MSVIWRTSTCLPSPAPFSKIPPADMMQLAGLLYSAWQKVAELKDAFERPFRTGTAADALPTLRESASASTFATASTSAPVRPMIAAAGAVAVWADERGLAWTLSLRPLPRG
ncbi:hypothetical protein EDB89DRAFT_2070819 [Lactarius sanguifluus]|nr:hypothetical protein EDB89DRAFT_2070819 [Lactarius sanguifluus]